MPDLEDPPIVVAQVPITPAPAEQVPADEFDRDRAMATITKLRAFEKDAKAKIARLAELEAAEQERSTADLSENDRLKKQIATLHAEKDKAHARLHAELIKSAAASAAITLQLPFAGNTALDDAVALNAFADLELGDDGKVAGINDAIRALFKARPYLFGQAVSTPMNINATARNSGGGQIDTEAELTRKRSDPLYS